MFRDFQFPEYPDDLFNMIVRDINSLEPNTQDSRTVGELRGLSFRRTKPIVASVPPPHPAPPTSPYAEPRVYGLRLSVKGDLSAGSLVKTFHGGAWRHVVFHGRVSAVCWLNPRYSRQWPEFIEIERLRVEDLAALDSPIFPEEIFKEPTHE